ncbi:MAG: hypothetical protein ACRDLQ_10265 [Solirubrobacterales bacterium]
MVAPVENAVLQWEDGYARVQAARRAGGARQGALGRVVMLVERELRKRLGSRFSVDELAAVYRDQGDALLDEALATMPEDQQPLGEASAACDAAFYLYMREASDFGGGRNRPSPS